MAISLGTRSRDNMRFGAGNVYIAEGGTVSVGASFGDSITAAALTTLLSSFSLMGTLEQNPRISSEAISVSEIYNTDPDIIYDRQHQSRVKVDFSVVEMDNTMINTLISRAEAATLTDFLFVRSTDVGDMVSFVRNIPFSVEIIKNHSWETIEKALVKVNALTFSLVKIYGQKTIT